MYNKLCRLWAFCGAAVLLGAALVSQPVAAFPLSLAPKPHPLVVWHGLGDSAHSEVMNSFVDSFKEAFPGLYVHSVTINNATEMGDRRESFFGKVNSQVEQACQQIASIQELEGGFDAIGFSQGGQFLRAYVERCNSPPVRNLVTFGSQHMGIADLPACTPGDLLCGTTKFLLRNGVYSSLAQSNVVSAQYFRNPRDRKGYERYLQVNDFIKDINNEGDSWNQEYRSNMLKLDNFVMVMFDKDITVVPRQSSWFASYPVRKEDDDDSDPWLNEALPLRQSRIYLEDRIGLKQLDERGGLVMELCHGPHMQIDSACQLKIFGKYIGTPSVNSVIPALVRHRWARLLYTGFRVRMESVAGILVTQIMLVTVMLVAIRTVLGLVMAVVQYDDHRRGIYLE